MPTSEVPSDTIQQRALHAIDEMQKQLFRHVSGMDRVLLTQANALLRPRLEQRINSSSADALQEQLTTLRDLLNNVLRESVAPKQKLSRRPKSKSKRSTSVKKRNNPRGQES